MRKILLTLFISFLFVAGISALSFCSQQDNPESRVSSLLQVAQGYIEGISQSTAGNEEGIENLVEEYEVIVQDIEDSIEETTSDEGLLRAIEAVSSGTARHLEVLEGLLDKVPEKARSAIEHAIEVSQRGREKALSRLQEVLLKRERERERIREEEQLQEQEQLQEEERFLGEFEKPEHPGSTHSGRSNNRRDRK